ncbi:MULTISPECIES: glycoside hydrolase family 5 protein [Pseudoxanthomonas]|uniref:Endoglucanase n=1 Tax=Pseudoxanthomonas taiwanensis J19 TaxID=935569 RepID=A0A562DHG7_9GAMM|nr:MULTISPECIES: glycoside hydrolase family 5 protein [Pseudoxanthomonas]TWH09045.1 endoglucanase [Pseudoxanthomonas taiwanensis J19]
MSGIRLLAGLCLGLMALLPQAMAQPPLSAHEQVARMGAGVNVLGYDPYWQPGGQGNYREEHFARIRQAGLGTVRVVLFTFPHLDQDNRLDPAWLEKLDQVLAWGRNNDLQVILDVHDFNDCVKDVPACEAKLVQVWTQLGERYAAQPDSVVFELLNEPHGALDARAWNALLAKLLQVVRKTNPTRNVVVGPTRWNNLEELDTLRLPEDDRHLVVTFHYYEPFAFTHQGASWVEPQFSEKTGVRFTPAQVAKIESDFDKVEAWSRRHGRPILLGEYGAYDKAPMEDRVLWTRTVARAAEKRGFAHLYWQFSSDFVLYDFQREDWVEPLLHAVVPPKQQD